MEASAERVRDARAGGRDPGTFGETIPVAFFVR